MIFSNPHAEKVTRIFAEAHDHNWDEIILPEDPVKFLTLWDEKNQKANAIFHDQLAAINEIDSAVMDWYGVPSDLRGLLESGLPWARE